MNKMSYSKILKKVNQMSPVMADKTDNQLKKIALSIKKSIELKEKQDRIIIEAFALVREVDKRILGLYPTSEQVYAAIAIYFGNIVEMKTGEGKSLVATMPLYLKALYEGTVFLITTNDYLAKRDFLKFCKVYDYLGLKAADGTNEAEEAEFNFTRKKQIYSSDIVYLSNSTFGFDFLINGLVERQEDTFLPELKFALLDEVDEILLDSAQMPLIISGAPKVQSNYFQISNDFIEILQEEIDYSLDEESTNVWLTEKGIEKAKHYFSIPNLLEVENYQIYQHIILALKAHRILKKERDYLVEDGKVKLLDRKDGRILEGTNLQSGLHQAVQAKERVEITPETQTISSITYQNLFRQFKQISGMSGTAKVSEGEFIETYNLPVKKVNTHKKNIRIDYPSQIYPNFKSKTQAVLAKIQELYSEGRPVLVITGSLDASELISTHLLNLGIPHNILNAKSSVKEAQIIKEAGKINAVTVSTAMAGRGTDIQMTSGAIQRGGLAVIISERMPNKRIEMQARGRAGRQGEPGSSYSFESLEDEIVKLYVQESVQRYYDHHWKSNKQIKSRRIKRYLERAQKLSEDRAYTERKKALQYDEVLRLQKRQIDQARRKIIELEDVSTALSIVSTVLEIVINKSIVEEKLNTYREIKRFILDNIDYNFKGENKKHISSVEEVSIVINEVFKNNIKKKKIRIRDDEAFLQYLKISILKAIDVSWSQQVDALNQLRFIVQSRTSAQKHPILEYEQEAMRSYDLMRNEITKLIVKNVSLSLLDIKNSELVVTFP